MIRRFVPAIFIPVIGVFLLTSVSAAAEDFVVEYEELIEKFGDSLADSTAAEAQVERADALYERIRQHRRDKRDDLSKAELDRLRDLFREVRNFKAVARVAGQVHNAAYVSIEGFDSANERLGLEPRVLQTHKSGLELVRIDVGEFASLLLRNPTKTTFTAMYGVNDKERPGGVGSATCESYSVMSGLFNSRDREIEGLEFTIEAHDTGIGSCD